MGMEGGFCTRGGQILDGKSCPLVFVCQKLTDN